MPIGKKHWAIPEGYIPPDDQGKPPEFISHESACLLNTGDRDAHVVLTIYFRDREPAGPYNITVAARRTFHMRFNDLKDPESIPLGKEYSSVFESDEPIVVQHTRLDGRRAEDALMTTIAYGES